MTITEEEIMARAGLWYGQNINNDRINTDYVFNYVSRNHGNHDYEVNNNYNSINFKKTAPFNCCCIDGNDDDKYD